MSKPLVGHHLMRVRISKRIFDRLQEVAEEECVRTGEHVTVSDIVRSACYNYLLIHDSVRQLESAGFDLSVFDDDAEEEDEDTEDVNVIINPFL